MAPSQVAARGYGESQPIADNSTAENRAQNRRVVMMVLQNPGNESKDLRGATGL